MIIIEIKKQDYTLEHIFYGIVEIFMKISYIRVDMIRTVQHIARKYLKIPYIGQKPHKEYLLPKIIKKGFEKKFAFFSRKLKKNILK